MSVVKRHHPQIHWLPINPPSHYRLWSKLFMDKQKSDYGSKEAFAQPKQEEALFSLVAVPRKEWDNWNNCVKNPVDGGVTDTEVKQD